MVRRLKASIGKQSSGFSRSVRLKGQMRSERASINNAIKSSKAITDAILDIFDQFEGVSDEIMLEAIEPTMKLAEYYCPKDTYALVNSRFAESVSKRGKPLIQFGFAYRGLPYYGSFVHEATWIPHAEPTRSKFLQAAVMEDLQNIYMRLGDGYKEFMGDRR